MGWEEQLENKYGLVDIGTGERFPKLLMTAEVKDLIRSTIAEETKQARLNELTKIIDTLNFYVVRSGETLHTETAILEAVCNRLEALKSSLEEK